MYRSASIPYLCLPGVGKLACMKSSLLLIASSDIRGVAQHGVALDTKSCHGHSQYPGPSMRLPIHLWPARAPWSDYCNVPRRSTEGAMAF